MLRITRVNPQADAGAITLRLEGKLLRPWADELVDAFERARANSDASAIVLDLGALTYADADGVRTLRELFGRGARPHGCSAFVAQLLGAGEQKDESQS